MRSDNVVILAVPPSLGPPDAPPVGRHVLRHAEQGQVTLPQGLGNRLLPRCLRLYHLVPDGSMEGGKTVD